MEEYLARGHKLAPVPLPEKKTAPKKATGKKKKGA